MLDLITTLETAAVQVNGLLIRHRGWHSEEPLGLRSDPPKQTALPLKDRSWFPRDPVIWVHCQ
jgi:hypothetical protein